MNTARSLTAPSLSVHPAHVRAATGLRKTLHRIPDLAQQETATAEAIVRFIGDFTPDEVITGLGGTGVAAVYLGLAPGPTVMIRCELDALPIEEVNDFAHRSTRARISHKCGHDGHMAMVAGLAPGLMQQPPARGRVVLLFQPAEEIGAGAAAVIRDPRFRSIAPDYVFALHNLPGYALHQIAVREGTFTMASAGMTATLEGRTSHASEPEHGISPARALESLLHDLPNLASGSQLQGFSLVTLTHLALGERSFGISPGRAELLATLRAEHDADLQQLSQRATELVTKTASAQGLRADVQWSDQFAATVNHADAVHEIVQAARQLGLPTQQLSDPIRWSEDFGLFTQTTRGAMFGLGAGIEQPALHSPDYDFPDALIPTGMALFGQVIRQVLGDGNN